MKLENPFPEYGYLGPEYFCDREYVALQKGSRIFFFLSFCRTKRTNQAKLSVPTRLVLTVPSFKHLLVLRIPLSGTPSTTGR